MDSETLKTNITSGRHWLRLVYMLLFAVLLYVAGVVAGAVIVLQFLFALLTGSPNKNLRVFGESLAQYIYRVLAFLTYSSEDKPFPFSDWPEAEPVKAPAHAKPSGAQSTPEPTPQTETDSKDIGEDNDRTS